VRPPARRVGRSHAGRPAFHWPVLVAGLSAVPGASPAAAGDAAALTLSALVALGLGALLLGPLVIWLLVHNRRLRRHLRQDAALLAHIGDGLMVTDADQRILRVNRSFCEITGYPPEEVIGRTPRLLRSGRHDEAFYREMWETVGRDGAWKGEIWNRRRDGQLYAEWLSIAAVRDDRGAVINYVATFSDITRMKVATEHLHYLAHHHPLTGLPNRLLLMGRLEHALDQSRRSRSGVAVLFIDLDGFKDVNDTFGHAAGDRILISAARRLSEQLRRGDTAAHLGGDEFVVVVERIYRPTAAATVARKLAAALSAPLEEGGREVVLGASIGISLFPGDADAPEALIGLADQAMYRAKRAGGGRIAFWSEAGPEEAGGRAV
jgi:diguanylate cyclase (GGDEF)-like protein/PAS domain S-box-containing protein